MRRPRYPLEPVLAHRERKVDAAARALAASVRARETAEERRLRAEAEANEVARKAEETRAREAEALGRGELTAADLARAGAWETRARAEAAALVANVDRASHAEAVATAEEATARGELAQKKADADVVDKDRARWTAKERAHADARDEEAAAEAWRPRGSE